ncbi:MAG: putative OB-fold protein [Glaciecola sp.]|jgi:uncharacterized OB-fold protein|uniref:Zn-ribbon domain-containing OB-fold protein n=1 Tax=Congregibacter sp. TaxID=2744308 RepID=UPI0039E4412A
MNRVTPSVTALSAPWFDACARGELLLQHCGVCDVFQFYPRSICAQCGEADPRWVQASGQGHVMSFTIVQRALSKAYDAPYVVALIKLKEGPTMMSNITGAADGELQIGLAVTAHFEAWNEDIHLPVFCISKEEPAE